MTQRFEGTGAGTGIGSGAAYWLDTRSGTRDTGESSAPSPAAAWDRIESARETVLGEIEAERSMADNESESILRTHEAILRDPALESRMRDALDSGVSDPAAAVETAIDEWITRFEAVGDRTAARADDLRDLRGRLLRALDGERTTLRSVPAGRVLLVDRLTPSVAARLDLDAVAGIATCAGSRTAHATLIARAREVPIVVAVGDGLRAVDDGTHIRVDAARGQVEVDPDDQATGRHSADDASTASRVRTPGGTTSGPETVRCADGTAIGVTANVGSGDEAVQAAAAGANGIGLFRTELLAYEREDGQRPSAAEQYTEYREALDAFPEGQVAIRTFDFGGDKPGPSPAARDSDRTAGETDELRGIARSLADPEAFRGQLRSICRATAAGAGEASIVLPHVTELDQVHAARDHLEDVRSALEADDAPETRPTLAVMIETPEAVELAPELAELVDAFAIGTNDLGAHLRGGARDSSSMEGVDPRLLEAVRTVAKVAVERDVPLRCCGASASDPAVAAALVGLGVDELSVPPVDVPRITQTLDGLDRSAASARAEAAITADSAAAARSQLDRWSP